MLLNNIEYLSHKKTYSKNRIASGSIIILLFIILCRKMITFALKNARM